MLPLSLEIVHTSIVYLIHLYNIKIFNTELSYLRPDITSQVSNLLLAYPHKL